MNIHSSRVTGSGSLASTSSFSRDLHIIGQKYRESSAAFNRALEGMQSNNARTCANALIDFRCELLKQITLCQQLEAKLQFALQDDWENASEVYRD